MPSRGAKRPPKRTQSAPLLFPARHLGFVVKTFRDQPCSKPFSRLHTLAHAAREMRAHRLKGGRLPSPKELKQLVAEAQEIARRLFLQAVDEAAAAGFMEADDRRVIAEYSVAVRSMLAGLLVGNGVGTDPESHVAAERLFVAVGRQVANKAATRNQAEWSDKLRSGQWRKILGTAKNSHAAKLHELKTAGFAHDDNRQGWKLKLSVLDAHQLARYHAATKKLVPTLP
jgi:hypothetical protein